MTQRKRTRRTRIERAGSVLLCLLSALLLASSEGPHVAAVSGKVELATGVPPVFRPAQPGDPVVPGDVIRTGADGRAELMLGRATVRLYPNSLLRVPDSETTAGGPRAVELDRGRSLFDVIKRPDDPFEVRTPEVVVSVKGTRFSVAIDEAAAAVAVYRGLVGVSGLGGGDTFETMVREGFVAAGRDSFELSLHGIEDPWQGWSAGRVHELPTIENLRLPDSARASVLEARTAAIRSARPAAVAAAAERHPEVAAKLESVRKLEAKAKDGSALDESVETLAEVDVDGSKEARRKARREERLERKRLRRDAVLDQKRRNRIETKLEESFVESVLVEALPDDPAAMSPKLPDPSGIDVSFVSNAVDGDRVWVQLSDALSWQFDRKYLKKVKKDKAVLPVELADLLASSGVSQKDFAKTALKLFK